MLTQDQAIEKAQHPEMLIDEREINDILGYLNGFITDIKSEEWEKQLVASQKHVELLRNPDYTNARAEAEWKVSQEYIDWQQVIHKRQKFNAYREDLRSRQEMLMRSSKYIRNL